MVNQEKNPIRKFWMTCRRPEPVKAREFTLPMINETRTVWQGFDIKIEEPRLSDASDPPSEVKPVLPPNVAWLLNPSASRLDASQTRKHHWVSNRTFQEAKLQTIDNRATGPAAERLTNHIIVCLFVKPTASSMDLAEFVMPLRSGDIPADELKEIVFLGNLLFLEKEWNTLCNFPKITVARGNPMERSDLEMVAIRQCDTCVVMQSKGGHSKDEIVDDRDAILATLNLTAMKSEETWRESRNMSTASEGGSKPPKALQKIITNVEHDYNVQFLDRENSAAQKSLPMHLADPFISGSVFMESVLDAIMVTPLACSLLRSMVHGKAQMGIMNDRSASGTSFSFIPCPTVEQGLLKVINMGDGLFSKFVNGPYTNVVAEAFASGIVCIGVARHENKTGFEKKDRMTYPLINPSPDLIMREDDDLYVFASYVARPSRQNIAAHQPTPCRRTILIRRSDPTSKKLFLP